MTIENETDQEFRNVVIQPHPHHHVKLKNKKYYLSFVLGFLIGIIEDSVLARLHAASLIKGLRRFEGTCRVDLRGLKIQEIFVV